MAAARVSRHNNDPSLPPRKYAGEKKRFTQTVDRFYNGAQRSEETDS